MISLMWVWFGLTTMFCLNGIILMGLQKEKATLKARDERLRRMLMNRRK